MEGAAMTAAKDQFLGRVRDALAKGTRAGQSRQLAPRGGIGYQGAGPDPVKRFCDELTAAGGHAHCVRNRDELVLAISELVQRTRAQKILLGGGPFIDSLGL